MPIYDYHCQTCGSFELMRRMSQSDAPAVCPHCGGAAGRILLTAPGIADMPAARRHAMATNERARHEPGTSATHQHHAGCGCGKAHKPADSSAPRSFADKRPWMISH